MSVYAVPVAFCTIMQVQGAIELVLSISWLDGIKDA